MGLSILWMFHGSIGLTKKMCVETVYGAKNMSAWLMKNERKNVVIFMTNSMFNSLDKHVLSTFV